MASLHSIYGRGKFAWDFTKNCIHSRGAVRLGEGTKTATATAGAATLNQPSGKVTSEAITTAAGAVYTLTLTNSVIEAADQVYASVSLGAGTGGTAAVCQVKPAAGSCTIAVQNVHGSAAFNAAIVISYFVVKA